MKKIFFCKKLRIFLLLCDVYAASADSGAWMTRYFDNNVVRQVFEIKNLHLTPMLSGYMRNDF